MKYLLVLFLVLLSACSKQSEDSLLAEANKFEQAEDWEKAIEILDKTIAQYPKSVRAYLNRGADLSALGNQQGAIEDYLTVIKLDPDNVLAHYNIGLNKNRQKKWDEATEWYNKALKLKGGGPLYIENPEDPFDVSVNEILFNRAISYMDNENNLHFDRAIEGFENCASNFHRKSESLNNIGCILIWRDQISRACECFSEAMNLANPEAKENYEKFCR